MGSQAVSDLRSGHLSHRGVGHDVACHPTSATTGSAYAAAMKWLVLVCAFAGCTKTNSVTCSDGRVCPSDKVCDDTHQFCVTEEQSTVCVGKPDGDECTAGALEGHCLDGICLPSVCGDGVAEFGEMCDDRNTFEEDMCSADCKSTRVCMNNVVDPDLGEQCDDGNHLDHDGCASNCLLETPRWFERTLPPAARTSAAYAYDSRRGRLVVEHREAHGRVE